MAYQLVCLLLGSILLIGCAKENTQQHVKMPNKDQITAYIDPFIGTAGDHGQLHPAASMPFGMVQMGPETPGRPHSGYDYYSTEFLGFSHLRTDGVGCRGSGGSVLTRADYINDDKPMSFSPVKLDKTSEQATAGYYSVVYGQDKILAEMTVSPASGWQIYQFPKAGEVVISVDLTNAHHKFYEADYQVSDSGEVNGRVRAATVCDLGKFQTYFNLMPSQKPQKVSQVDQHKFLLHYSVQAGKKIALHTGFSAVSTNTAKEARLTDANIGGFTQAKQHAKNLWEQLLSKVQIEANDETKKIFYSHLYRVYLSPSNLTHSTNTYRAPDNKVYSKVDSDYYYGWSIWDNFRTQLPLLTILEPSKMREITASLAKLYTQDKQNWATQNAPLPSVRTEHSAIVLLDAWQKGIRGFDLAPLLPYLVEESAQMPRKSPDQILEAAYGDWAIAKLAKLAGDEKRYQQFLSKAAQYRDIWRDKFKVMTAKSDIMHGDGLYEGTLWQYRWFVPHDLSWIINELDGERGFNNQLTQFFERHLFNMANQPDIQTPFLFNFTGEAWRTQKLIHELINTETVHYYKTHEKRETPVVRQVFQAKPEGMLPEMDNDAATMSAWYVFTMMGLYPAVPGEAVYSLHTPQLNKITLNLENGNQLLISTDKPPAEYPYIHSVELNGQLINRAWITHEEIQNGGDLQFKLGATANLKWGQEHLYQTKLN